MILRIFALCFLACVLLATSVSYAQTSGNSTNIKQVDTLTPSIPSRLKVVNLQPKQVSLGWNHSTDSGGSGIAGYRIYRNWRYIGETLNPAYTDESAKPDSTYFYAVSAFDSSANQNHSALRSIRVRTPSVATVTPATSHTVRPIAVAPVQQQSVVAPQVDSTVDTIPHSGIANRTAQQQALPLGGQFYGTIKGGMMTGNGPIAFENAIRFRAERSGTVQAMRYNNRVLRNIDIDKRCDLYGKSSAWCKCKDAGLDNISCGYTLSNSYHVGSGGLITVELRNDDGSAQHLPGKTVLTSSEPYVPANSSKKFPTIQFKKNVQLKAGELYHLVFRNDNYPTSCKLRGLSVSEASRCPRNEGAMGLNGTKHASDPSSLSLFGPYLGNSSSGLLYRRNSTGRWLTQSDVTAFYELQYTNGDYVGDSYAGSDNPNYGSTSGTQTIEGATVARQEFLVEDSSRDVDGLWLQFGHVFDRKVNLKPLRTKLKDLRGNVLATGTLPASAACNDIAYTAGKDGVSGTDGKARSTRDDWMCRTWKYTDLSTVVSLIEGQRYSVEFTAPTGAGYNLSTYHSSHFQKSHNDWDNASAQISFDNGRSWNSWATTNKARDLPVLFTIQGMPKHLP